ncbi:pyridoxamine 5'-phosphate oxidase family protein [Humibacter ginsenosidimutans]|uniref:Pyridoxamine 5'-phosphate oxidase family protein n=1 Tax=Humibacter ginsenosidimutans TaxID=2599293 RepID=A0A5B8M3B4_9MICO|nr:pyridoxamine 5'-phosphate oxidase family protein [Humibacter ginsenosidimutans]QDZ14275.1 pyridoxamine 5'-phosphate oxidase family protein [Humibacter ginsenosidimutans]
MPNAGDSPSPIESLDPDACWNLLETQSLGRLAVAAERVEIFPVNFLVHERSVYFASAPGSKLMEILHDPHVAFEADGSASADLWSVVIHGRAVRLARDSDIEGSGVLRFKGWHPGEKHNYVRIIPDEITGRRFPRAE